MRLAYCYLCAKLERLDDFEIDFKDPHSAEHDVLLSNWIERHMHGRAVDDHPGGRLFPFDDSAEGVDTMAHSMTSGKDFDVSGLDALTGKAVEEVKKLLRDNQMEVMEYRDQLREDAGNCFIRHGNPEFPGKPCIDYEAADKRLGRKNTPKKFQQFLCTYCLAAETMVVTRQGVRRIDELATLGEAELLVVPTKGQYASWKTVPVRSYGVQRLWAVEMARGRQRRTVHATAEHRWASAGRVLKTSELYAGVVLDRASATPLSLTGEVPSVVGIMHGFTFGDGTAGVGNRPAYVTIYDNDKDKALNQYFVGCRSTAFDNGKNTGINYVDLPKGWKIAPDLNESRSYLLGFLAGYFAADGNVTAAGHAVMDSSRLEHIELVRSICNILGAQTSPVRSRMRSGFGAAPSARYSTTLRTVDFPGEFWIIEAHAARAHQRTDSRRNWSVVSVAETGRVEEVFCAEVGGSERFVLDDNLVTYNCPYESSVTVTKRARRGDYAK